jgi:plasmid stabilization system protein ParE
MMGLFWTPEAIQDRDDIYDYIEVSVGRASAHHACHPTGA